MNKEIIYLHPAPRGEAPSDAAGASYPVLPVGAVAHLNRLQRAGFAVMALNIPVERMINPLFRLDTWLQRPAPALVLLDLHWYEHAAGVVDAAARVKAAWPDTRIGVGGLTATRFARELIEICPAIDAVIAGDAEDATLALARAVAERAPWPPLQVPNLVARDGAQVVASPRRARTTQAQFDELDTASLDFLVHADAYQRLLHSRPARTVHPDLRGHWIANGRGCAFDCSYCGGSRSAFRQLTGLPGVMRRAPAVVAAEADRLVAQGVQQVALTLDPDMLGPTHQAAFFQALTTRPGLYVESFQLPSPRLIDALARHADPTHTELALTPLSGATLVRRKNGKHYDNDALRTAVDALIARDFSVFVFFSLNLPGEDEETLQETLALAHALLDQAPPDRLRIANICHTLDPVSPMAEAPAMHGIEVRLRTLADFVAYGKQPRPWSFIEGERGFSVPGRNIAAMVARWDALAAACPGRVIPVPRG